MSEKLLEQIDKEMQTKKILEHAEFYARFLYIHGFLTESERNKSLKRMAKEVRRNGIR